ncbi:hypothetical protein V8E51_001998 [Hyaloscypha variabilis]
MSSSKEQITQKEDEVPLLQGHSQGLNLFLAQLAGAYDTENKYVIGSAQKALVGALLTEKKIDKKRVEVKKDAQFVEDLKALRLSGEKDKDEK